MPMLFSGQPNEYSSSDREKTRQATAWEQSHHDPIGARFCDFALWVATLRYKSVTDGPVVDNLDGKVCHA